MNKIAQAPLDQLVSRCQLSPEALAAIAAAADAAAAIEALESNGFLAEAVRLFAHALPKREAVWWACMCTRLAPADAGTPGREADLKALETTENWVRQQDEDVRRQAIGQARAIGFQTAEAWAAAAAFWSGDSMAPPEAPAPIPPPPELVGVAVAGAVTLAGARGDPRLQNDRLKRFLLSARDIAAGGSGRVAQGSR